jgi:LuxR family maltose regulon positive regulatory protein
MTMSFLPFDPVESFSGPESYQSSSVQGAGSTSAFLHIPRAKLQIPSFDDVVERPRVAEVLKNSAGHFPCTVICGRSGTGKTAAVSSFAGNRKRVAWNSLEPQDIHWASFANSTLSAARGNGSSRRSRPFTDQLIERPDTKDVSRLADMIFSSDRHRRELFIFDNVHYVFDTTWFREFFELLLPAIPEAAHAIFISRSKPPFPLWRMRSKQFVNLIDEKVFAFDESETAELFRRNGFPETLAPVAHQNCFGKVSQMLRFAKASAEE